MYSALVLKDPVSICFYRAFHMSN